MEKGAEEQEKQLETVRRAMHGSREAFMDLYREYYREMYAYACYMLRHPQDAEDAVADTVVAAFESIRKLRDPSRFRQWIFKILSNQCKKRRKTYADRNQTMALPVETAQNDVDSLERASDGKSMEEEVTDRAWVQEAFDALSQEERYIVNSFLFGGYKGEEIAKSLGIGASTLRSKYRRALRKMKKILDE